MISFTIERRARSGSGNNEEKEISAYADNQPALKYASTTTPRAKNSSGGGKWTMWKCVVRHQYQHQQPQYQP